MSQFRGSLMKASVMVPAKTVLIVGGGIGGLTVAIALQQIGLRVMVLERAAVFREIGAGLWLWQNALNALNSLGLGDAVRSAGIEDAHGGIRSWRGAVLVNRVPEQRNHTSVAILRSDLQRVLLGALAPGTVQSAAECSHVRQDSDKVTVTLTDGTQQRADIVIGADGIHSPIRTLLFKQARPIYAGFTAWRAITNFPHEGLPSGVSWGHGDRFGVMPISGGRVNWFAGAKLPIDAPEPVEGRKNALLQRFRDWYDPIPAMIDATDEQTIIRNDIFYLSPLKHWTQGRITLLGDAAHAMTPSIGQGACQAIEDAVELANCLRIEADPVTALQQYETRRLNHANAVARYARRLDWLALWSNPILSNFRNGFIKRLPSTLRDRQLATIINGQGRR